MSWEQHKTWTWFHVKNHSGDGVKAHKTTNPGAKFFADHALVWRVDLKKLYDPSYGIAEAAGNEDDCLRMYENFAIDAYSCWDYDTTRIVGSDPRWAWVPNNMQGGPELCYAP